MPVIIGALREAAPHETRVSLVPEVAEKFAASGARVVLERGAGTRARFPDSSFKNVEWLDSGTAVLERSEILSRFTSTPTLPCARHRRTRRTAAR